MMPKPPTFSKCAFSEGGVKCGERAMPVARHCRKHILEVRITKCIDLHYVFAFTGPKSSAV